MANMSDYLENKLVDSLFRGQPYSFPTTVYFGLFTATPNDAGGGAEVSTSGSGYARVGVACSLANFSGTQAVGSTAVSNGTSGTTSNNSPITFGAPTANWGSIAGIGIYDAATGGNLLFYSPLQTAKTVNNGDAAPSFVSGAFSLQLDN